MALKWTFEEPPLQGGASGESYRNTLNASGVSMEHEVVREAIQNSGDAPQTPDEPVTVKFSHIVKRGEDLHQTIDLLDLRALSDRSGVLELPSGNILERLDDGPESLSMLVIEDWNTIGLGGSLTRRSKESHFRNLLWELGYADKARSDSSTGGSYGFGKAVYSGSSKIRTIIAYSVFAPTEDTEGAHARFMGCAYFQDHVYGETSYNGRAFMGREPDEKGLIRPLEDDEAHAAAAKLGINLRTPQETGTTIVILDVDPDVPSLVEGVETYWWPRLIDRRLHVEIYDSEGSCSIPRPRKNEKLTRFIRCYELATGIDDRSDDTREIRVNSIDGMRPGAGAVTRYPYDEQSELEEGFAINAIALIRGPRMVVSYELLGSPISEPIQGVFIASPDFEHVLKLSEPGTHDAWDPDSGRLSTEGKNAVQALLERLKRSVRRYQHELQPPPPRATGRVRRIERLLGRYLGRIGTGSQPAPEPEPDPIFIHFASNAQSSDDERISIRTIVEVGLKESTEVETLEVRVDVGASYLIDADARASASDKIRIVWVENEDEAFTIEGRSSRGVVLRKGHPQRLIARSEPIESQWGCNVSVHAEPLHA